MAVVFQNCGGFKAVPVQTVTMSSIQSAGIIVSVQSPTRANVPTFPYLSSGNVSINFNVSLPSGLTLLNSNCSIDNQTPVDCTSGVFTASNLADGSHQVQIIATANGGQSSAPTVVNFIVESTAPLVSITNPPAPGMGSNVQIGFQGFGNLSGVSSYACTLTCQCATPQVVTGSCTSPASYTNLSGPCSFSVVAQNQVGATSLPATASWTSGTSTCSGGTSSSYAISVNVQPTPTLATSASFTFSVPQGSDPTPGQTTAFTCILDGTATGCSNPQIYTGLAIGNHTFSISGIDGAGNQPTAPAAQSWTIVDASNINAPSATVNQSYASGTSSNISIVINPNVTGITPIGYMCRFNNAIQFTACTTPWSPSPTALPVGATYAYQIYALYNGGQSPTINSSFTVAAQSGGSSPAPSPLPGNGALQAPAISLQTLTSGGAQITLSSLDGASVINYIIENANGTTVVNLTPVSPPGVVDTSSLTAGTYTITAYETNGILSNSPIASLTFAISAPVVSGGGGGGFSAGGGSVRAN